MFRRLLYPKFFAASNDVLRRMVERIPEEDGVDGTRCLFDMLDEAHKFSVPKWMVEHEFRRIWRVVEPDRRAGQIDPFDVGKTESQLKSEYRVIAERRVRLGAVINEIGKRNNIAVRKEECPQNLRSAVREIKIVDFIFGLAGKAAPHRP